MVDLGALLLGQSRPEQAVGWFEQAAQAGNSDAQYALGQMLEPANKTEACGWLERGAEPGLWLDEALAARGHSATALAHWCRCLDRGAAQERCVEEVRLAGAQRGGSCGQAAKQGDPASQNDKAVRVVKSDPVEAMKLWEEAAMAGLAQAQFNLALAMERGTGGPQRLKQARYWYEQAVDQEESGAMFNLGAMLEAGRGGGQDPTGAAELFARARKRGVVQRVEVPGSGTVPELAHYELARDPSGSAAAG